MRGLFSRVYRGLVETARPLGRIAAAFAMLVALSPAPLAQAGTATANLTVQINITASCTINAATLNFGANVPGTTLVSSNITAQTTVSVTCTNGSPYSIGMDNGANFSGSRRMRQGATANYLSYGLFTDAGLANAWTTATDNPNCATANSCFLGTGNGSAQSVNIYGRVPSTGTAPPTGLYTDTVTMTITY